MPRVRESPQQRADPGAFRGSPWRRADERLWEARSECHPDERGPRGPVDPEAKAGTPSAPGRERPPERGAVRRQAKPGEDVQGPAPFLDEPERDKGEDVRERETRLRGGDSARRSQSPGWRRTNHREPMVEEVTSHGRRLHIRRAARADDHAFQIAPLSGQRRDEKASQAP